MSKEIRNKIREILEGHYLSEDMQQSQKDRLVSMLNALEFKNDVLSAGGDIYAVGGIVRDAVMGTPSDDLDIVVRGVPYDQLFAILSKYGIATDTSHVDENGKKDFGSTKFVSSNEKFNKFLDMNGVVHTIDVMLPRKDMKDPDIKGHKGIKSDVNPMYTIQDDLERRDITINAIAMDLGGNLIANGPGLEDIKNGVVRAVSEDAFIEDPLRMIRAIRFAARYDYAIDKGTENLIKKNAGLLADKAELPKERFLQEFEKMIGKSDLGRSVKLLIDFGLYGPMFGVKPKVGDTSKFDKVKNIGDFAYMMFDGQPLDSIVTLIEKNIANDNGILNYAKALTEYHKEAKLAKTNLDQVLLMARLYKISPSAMSNSIYIEPEFKNIIKKFETGILPKDDHGLALKGEDFKNFIVDTITQINGEFIPKSDGIKMGKAKNLVLRNVFDERLKNDAQDIKSFLLNSIDKWML
jgi:tRNA nucleotidyltransferase/poly(A) polymerase